MAEACCSRRLALLLMLGLIGCQRKATSWVPLVTDGLPPPTQADSYSGAKGGDERAVAGVTLRW